MSTRSKKESHRSQSGVSSSNTAPTTSSPGNVSGTASATASPSSSGSALDDSSISSTRLSRLEEKNTLIGLNNRLAAIIDRNHQLELENTQLISQVESSEETLEARTVAIKETIQKEGNELKKKIVLLENESARARLSETNLKKSLEDATKKLAKNETELNDLKTKFKVLQDKYDTTNNELHKQLQEKSNLQSNFDGVKSELKKVTDENGKLKVSLESSQLQAMQLQNSLRSLTDDVKLNSKVHEEELVAIKKTHQKRLEEVNGQLGKDYETKLQEAIKSLRSDCERQLRENKSEQENLFKLKENDFKSHLDNLNRTLTSKNKEFHEITNILKEHKNKIETLEEEKASLRHQMKISDENSKKAKDDLKKEIQNLEEQVRLLQESKNSVINDYQDLMEVKVMLDNEISTYRKLLEGEEQRLNISLEEKRQLRKRPWASTSR